MNVADSNPDGNPSSDANQTPQQICRQIDQFAETLKSIIEEAARSGDSFDSLKIHKMILSSGRRAVDLLVSLQGDGDLGDALTTQDGVTLHRSASNSRRARKPRDLPRELLLARRDAGGPVPTGPAGGGSA